MTTETGEPDTADTEEATERRRVSRRVLLQAALFGGAGIAALPLILLIRRLTEPGPKPLNTIYPLNSDWLFGGQYQQGAEAASFDDSAFAPVTLPHTTANLSWRGWSPRAWQHVWIYRRHFKGAPLLAEANESKNKNTAGDAKAHRVFAEFDGVMVNTTVVCNDQVVATHQGGYLPFTAELTSHLKHGDNVLSVVVDGRCLAVPPIAEGQGPASIDFLQPGGIYRDVDLRVVPQVFVSDMYAMPANVLSPSPRVDVRCTVDAGVKPAGPATLQVELLDGTSVVASKTTKLTIPRPGITQTGLTLAGLSGITLWSTENPKLYTVRAVITVPDVGAHVITRRIGFRDVRFTPDGCYLNGRRLQLFGLDRHQLYPYTGMAMPARVQRKDAEIIKNDFNCNMVRCSHYPQSPHFLDACDELGLLVWEEAPGWDHVSTMTSWQDQVIQNVKDMVTRDRNRPSVIIWGTRLNETGAYPGLWAATREAARQLDPSRPSSGAMDLYTTRFWAEDVFAFNDYSHNKITGVPHLRPPMPGVPYLVTEAVGVMVSPDARRFAWTDPPEQLARQASLHAQVHSQARSSPNYAGLLGWAAFDYCSMHGTGPTRVKWAGVADGFRIPKPAAAIYQSQIEPWVTAVIIPVFFWEADGLQPTASPETMIASNCEQLGIYLNGVRLQTALPASDSPEYANLPYPPFIVTLPEIANPGELMIRGYVGGRQVAEVRMSSDPSRDHLVMTADDTAIAADGSDMTRVVFRGVDAYGNQRRGLIDPVLLDIEGPGELIGDNPFEFGDYGGLGAVWVRSIAGRTGTVTVTASHPSLGRAMVRVRSVQT